MTSIHTAVPDLEPIAQFTDLGEAQEHVLVVLAMNLDCLITIDEEQNYYLHADPAFACAIHQEFSEYAKEQTENREPPHVPIFSSGIDLALLWACSLLFFFILSCFSIR